MTKSILFKIAALWFIVSAIMDWKGVQCTIQKKYRECAKVRLWQKRKAILEVILGGSAISYYFIQSDKVRLVLSMVMITDIILIGVTNRRFIKTGNRKEA